MTITSSTERATIYYTLDGSAPSRSSLPYAGPFLIDKTKEVNAIAVAPGSQLSPVATVAYTCSSKKMTRADFATSIQGQFGLPQPAQPFKFTDVKPGDALYPAAQAIAPYLHRQVLCPGCFLSSNFSPSKQMSRAEVAVALVSILVTEGKMELPSVADANSFLAGAPDTKELPVIARRYIAAAVRIGILELEAGGRIGGYEPYSPTEMVAALATMQKAFGVPSTTPAH